MFVTRASYCQFHDKSNGNMPKIREIFYHNQISFQLSFHNYDDDVHDKKKPRDSTRFANKDKKEKWVGYIRAH